MPAKRTVHIVDDDVAVRHSLERLLHAAGFHSVSYGSPLTFLDTAPALSGGCLLLNVCMPEMDGLEVQARLNDLAFRVPVIVMTAQGNVATAVRAMKAGAADFIEMPYRDDVLIAAIKAAFEKPVQHDPRDDAKDAAKRIALLSKREREVLDALMAGRRNKVIAFDLGISVRTVEVHRARMMERLGVRQLAEAIRIAVMATLDSPH